MQTKTKNSFKAVEYMRRVRTELSSLAQTDKSKFHRELKEAMENFLSNQKLQSEKKV